MPYENVGHFVVLLRERGHISATFSLPCEQDIIILGAALPDKVWYRYQYMILDEGYTLRQAIASRTRLTYDAHAAGVRQNASKEIISGA